jgi:hypothetical protein
MIFLVKATAKRLLPAALCAAAAMAAASANAAPKIAFEKTQVDFGTLGQGKSVELVYRFRNIGDQELTIGNIHASCGCTDATAAMRSLKPGESSEIRAKFNSGSFRGRITKTITVETNDPDNRAVQLTVVGYVKPSVEVFPQSINFGTLKKGRTFQQTVVLKPEDPSKFTIRSVDARAPFITVGQPVRSKSVAGAWELHVKIDSSRERTGRVYDMIQIRTDVPVQPLVVVRVIGAVVE